MKVDIDELDRVSDASTTDAEARRRIFDEDATLSLPSCVEELARSRMTADAAILSLSVLVDVALTNKSVVDEAASGLSVREADALSLILDVADRASDASIMEVLAAIESEAPKVSLPSNIIFSDHCWSHAAFQPLLALRRTLAVDIKVSSFSDLERLAR